MNLMSFHSMRLATMRRLGGGAMAIVLRGGMLVLSVLTVTLVAPFLGVEDLGRFAALQALTAWTSLVGLGLVEACSGILGKFLRADKRADGKRYVDAAFRRVAVAAAIAAGLLIVAAIGPVLAQRIELQTLWPFAISLGCALLAMPFTVVQAPLNAEGAVSRNTAWGFATAAASLGALWFVIHSSLEPARRLVFVAAATGVATMVVRMAMYRVEMRRLYGAQTARRTLSARQVRALQKTGLPFIVITAAALAAFQTDRLIAYTFLSAAEAAQLDVVLKVFFALYSLYAVVVARLWRTVGQPWNDGDRQGARHAMLQAVRTALLFWSAAGSVLVLSIDPIVQVFTHGTVVVQDPLFVIMVAAYMAVRTAVDTISLSIFAIRRQHLTLRTVIAHGLLNIPCSIAGGLAFGLTGIVAGQLLALLLTSGWRFPLIFWKASSE